jgi:hypothetical protein
MDLFSSSNNKDLLFGLVRKNVQTNLNSDLSEQAQTLINNAIDYIKSKISPQTPPNMDKEQYKNLMNKKVIDLVLPIIYQGELPPVKQPVPPKPSPPIIGTKLDASINQHKMSFQEMLPHPQSQSRSSGTEIMKQYDAIENERFTENRMGSNYNNGKNIFNELPKPILPQALPATTPLKSIQERFKNTERYITSNEAEEPESNIHLRRRQRQEKLVNEPMNEHMNDSRNEPRDQSMNNQSINEQMIDLDSEDSLNKFLDEIGKEIEIQDNPLNGNNPLNSNKVINKNIKTLDADDSNLNDETNVNNMNNVNDNDMDNFRELIIKKGSSTTVEGINLDVQTTIRPEFDARNNFYKNTDLKKIAQAESRESYAIKAVNDMDNNYQNQSDLQMLEEINDIKDPHRDVKRNHIATNNELAMYSGTYPIIPQNRTKYIIKENYITVDSQDRDLELYPEPTRFQVKFEPAADTITTVPVYDINNNFIYDKSIRIAGESRGAYLYKRFDNIVSISVVCVLIPLKPIWLCGNRPNRYNTAVQDFNTGAFPGVANGPVLTSDTGVLSSVLKEPYIILKIDELESYSPYYGTNKANNNAFAKLIYNDAVEFNKMNCFAKFSTYCENEKFIFGPHTLNSIDKMTLNLIKYTGLPINFGRDKTYISSIEEGGPQRNCMSNATRIIICPAPNCDPCDDRGIDMELGDVLFFYRVKPNCQNIIPLNPNINVDTINFIEDSDGEISKLIELVLIIKEDNGNGDESRGELCLNGIINPGDYLAISYKNTETNEKSQELIKVIKVNGNIVSIIIDDFQAKDSLDIIDIIGLGIGKSNPKGIQSEDNCNSLEYIAGFCVCKIIDKVTFEIDLPFNKLPSELSNGNVFKEYFYINQRLQISYTFKIETKEKDYFELDSEAVF